jgi:hypothetical protein
MAQRYTRPDWVRRLNAMADAGGSAVAMIPIDAGSLVDDARVSTGVDAFADLGDGDWEGRLRALVAAINASDLTVVGRLMTREELLRALRTRLHLGAERRRDPSVAAEQIVAPIVVTGPARSGTTILFELLALDSGLRSPIATDVLHPALPASLDAAKRRAMTESEQELWADVQPEFAAIHELRADLPVECITITAPSFAGGHWSMLLDEPGEWMPDPGPDFAFHRAVLQSVQHGKPARQWLLKTPAYVMLFAIRRRRCRRRSAPPRWCAGSAATPSTSPGWPTSSTRCSPPASTRSRSVTTRDRCRSGPAMSGSPIS